MAEKIRKLSNSEMEVLAKIVGECMSGIQMNNIFDECFVVPQRIIKTNLSNK